MHVISRKKLREFSYIHPDAKKGLDNWFRVLKKERWMMFADIRLTFRSADQVGKYTIFNIGGNKYRVICEINYRSAKVFLRHVLTHDEYSRGAWKNT